jgi:serine/threonine protein kinase
MTLVLEDPGGMPLDRLLGRPLDVSHFLRIAIPLTGALRQVHERGLIHKDIKPANILLDTASGGVWLTGHLEPDSGWGFSCPMPRLCAGGLKNSRVRESGVSSTPGPHFGNYYQRGPKPTPTPTGPIPTPTLGP